MTASTARKTIVFAGAAAVAVVIATGPLLQLMRQGPNRNYYTHIPLVPLISAYVLFKRRKHIAVEAAGSGAVGTGIAALGVILIVIDLMFHLGPVPHAELRVGGAILITIGTFLGLFGATALRKTLFPFLFLGFTIPLPLGWMHCIVAAMVTGSAAFTSVLFMALGVPFVQSGPLFHLPAIDILVAEACSGIRSSLALVITCVLAGQLFLRSRWKKIALVVAVVPITVMKNAIRIVTLYLLSYFIDIRIIEGGFLHRSGGFIFFGLGLAMLAFVLWVLTSPRVAWARLFGVPVNNAPKTLDSRPPVSDNTSGKESGGLI